jgi:hypothetical protein
VADESKVEIRAIRRWILCLVLILAGGVFWQLLAGPSNQPSLLKGARPMGRYSESLGSLGGKILDVYEVPGTYDDVVSQMARESNWEVPSSKGLNSTYFMSKKGPLYDVAVIRGRPIKKSSRPSNEAYAGDVPLPPVVMVVVSHPPTPREQVSSFFWRTIRRARNETVSIHVQTPIAKKTSPNPGPFSLTDRTDAYVETIGWTFQFVGNEN